MPFVDERVGGHDLDRGDAELRQMFNRGRMRESCESPARGFGDRRVEPRKAAQVEFVDDERLGRDALMSRLPRRRRSRNRLWRVRAGVLAEREHRRMDAERPVETATRKDRPAVWTGRNEVPASDHRDPARESRIAPQRRPQARCHAGRRQRHAPSAREQSRDRRRRRIATRPRRWAARAPLRGRALRRRRRERLSGRSFGGPDDLAIKRCVSLRRAAPGDVRPHAVESEPP